MWYVMIPRIWYGNPYSVLEAETNVGTRRQPAYLRQPQARRTGPGDAASDHQGRARAPARPGGRDPHDPAGRGGRLRGRGARATPAARAAWAAGVSPETVQKGFGTKAALAKAVYDVTLVG